MKLDSLGQTFYDGRIIDLDNPSEEILDTTLEQVKKQNEKLKEKLSNLIIEMQK